MNKEKRGYTLLTIAKKQKKKLLWNAIKKQPSSHNYFLSSVSQKTAKKDKRQKKKKKYQKKTTFNFLIKQGKALCKKKWRRKYSIQLEEIVIMKSEKVNLWILIFAYFRLESSFLSMEDLKREEKYKVNKNCTDKKCNKKCLLCFFIGS